MRFPSKVWDPGAVVNTALFLVVGADPLHTDGHHSAVSAELLQNYLRKIKLSRATS